MKNNFLNGFIKAAQFSGLSSEHTLSFVKEAFSDLTPADIAQLRESLHEQGANAPYGDPYGPTNSVFNQAILSERDRSSGQDANLAAAGEAAKKSISGGAVGGVAGHTLGNFLKTYKPSAAGSYSHRVKGKLPLALGVGGTVAGALLSAIPAYNRKQQSVAGFQKLNDPQNMQRMIESLQADKALLNS